MSRDLLGGLPPSTKRLFFGYPEADLLAVEYRPFLVSRLLEEGDSEDLSWLASQVSEEEMAAALALRGGGGFSLRSRAFWSLLLGKSVQTDAFREEIWPK